MRWICAISALLVAAPALAADDLPALSFKGWDGPLPKKPPCECRSKQGKVGLGTKMCMRQGERMVTMECTLVLNNTAWRRVQDGCDVAALDASTLR